jgi:hypothetical protein
VDAISSSFDFVLQLTPIDTETAWHHFRHQRFSAVPEFHYRPLSFDVQSMKRELCARCPQTRLSRRHRRLSRNRSVVRGDVCFSILAALSTSPGAGYIMCEPGQIQRAAGSLPSGALKSCSILSYLAATGYELQIL